MVVTSSLGPGGGHRGGPGHANLTGLAASSPLNARHLGMDEGPVFEEMQVLQDSLAPVVDGLTLSRTCRTGEVRAAEISHLKIDPCRGSIEIDVGDLPRCRQTQGGGELGQRRVVGNSGEAPEWKSAHYKMVWSVRARPACSEPGKRTRIAKEPLLRWQGEGFGAIGSGP